MINVKQLCELSGDDTAEIENILSVKDAARDHSPIYINILTALGGWLSAMLFLGAWGALTGSAGIFVSLALPGILGVGAGLMMRSQMSTPYAQQMGAGLVVVGQIALGIGMAEVMGSSSLFGFFIISIVAFLVFIFERRGLLAAVSTAIALVSLAVFLIDVGMKDIRDSLFAIVCISIGIGIFLKRIKGFRVEYIALAAFLALIIYAEASTIEMNSSIAVSEILGLEIKALSFLQLWGGEIVGWLGAMYFLFWAKDIISKIELIVATLLMSIFTVFMSFTGTAAFFLLLVGVIIGWRPAAISGLLAVIWSLSRFYYDLSYTLMDKSIMLISAGAAILLLTYFLQKHKDAGVLK